MPSTCTAQLPRLYGLTAFGGRGYPVAPVVWGLAAAGGGPSGETPQCSPGPRGQTHGHAVSCPGLPPHCGNLGPVTGWRGHGTAPGAPTSRWEGAAISLHGGRCQSLYLENG